MCLSVPGQVLEITREDELGFSRGKVQFRDMIREVNLTYLPDLEIGDYVVVHVGFAINKVSKEEAYEIYAYLEKLDA